MELSPDHAATSQIESRESIQQLVLRHLLATLAYRAAKVLRDVPSGFADTTFSPVTRRPVAIVAHLADLMAWAITLARGDNLWRAGGADDWDTEIKRFVDELGTLDHVLLTTTLPSGAIEQLIQGPLSDALTHVGQLALLRGMAHAPIRPESFAKAQIVVGTVGLDQAPPRRPFDGDASERKKT